MRSLLQQTVIALVVLTVIAAGSASGQVVTLEDPQLDGAANGIVQAPNMNLTVGTRSLDGLMSPDTDSANGVAGIDVVVIQTSGDPDVADGEGWFDLRNPDVRTSDSLVDNNIVEVTRSDLYGSLTQPAGTTSDAWLIGLGTTAPNPPTRADFRLFEMEVSFDAAVSNPTFYIYDLNGNNGTVDVGYSGSGAVTSIVREGSGGFWAAGGLGSGVFTVDGSVTRADGLKKGDAAIQFRGVFGAGDTFTFLIDYTDAIAPHTVYELGGFTIVSDVDSDFDGVPDDEDVCPGFNDNVDDDSDGQPNGCDPCPTDPTDADTDQDGTCDVDDICPTDPNDVDDDGDGVCDVVDICIGASNVDSDGDQICDDIDLCQGNDATGDTDVDGICDGSDNCPNDANSGQEDADGDLIGDVCEADSDADGKIDDLDNCPADFNPDQADNDGDLVGDLCDPDDDNDGVGDGVDNCPVVANSDQADSDGDGAGDACSDDDDADGVADADDLCPGTSAGVPIDSNGCSGGQAIALACEDNDPCAFPNHGKYQSCVVHEVNAAVASGLLSNKEASMIKRAAAKARCE